MVVLIHWGIEREEKPQEYQRALAKRYIDAGADLVIGSHPHVLQPIGYQGDVPVVYSLGNYLFNSKTLDSCLVEAVIGDEGLESLRFIPAKQSNCRVAKAEGAEKERIINYMRSISPEAVIDDEGYITKQNAQ